MKTVTLNLSLSEMAVLNELAERKGMSKTAVMRQALKLYQLVEVRAAAGQHLVFSDGLRMSADERPAA